MRSAARDLFLHALGEAGIARAFDRHVQYSRGILRIAEDLYDLGAYTRVFVVAIGKAAHTMAEALAAQVGTAVGGIVATAALPAGQVPGFRYFEGGHPTPNAESLRAARAILQSLAVPSLKPLAIYLLSGGGSSLVEQPIFSEISLDDLVATYRALVLSGAPIAEINAIRKHLSSVKGGRLAQAAAPARQVSVMVSDVPDSTPDALASGPSMPDPTTADDCYRIAEQYKLLEEFPSSVRDLFERRALPETAKKDDPAFWYARWWPILSNATAVKAAAAKAAAAGFTVEIDNTPDDWDYARAADYLLDRLRKLRRTAPRACLIFGGEVTVKVPQECGTGGRNQHFALYCATKIAGERITVLSGGTDGIDGNSPTAGAIADGTTVSRARERGLDPATALARFDAFPLFEALGDTLRTGPTGNNLRDLRILLAY